jgi:dihydropyrimidinase
VVELVSYDLVVRGGRLVGRDGVVEADIGVVDGRFAAVGHGLEGTRRVDAGGAYVLPGLVDPHVHPIHAETYGSASDAALHGGITTTLHHLYTPPDADPVDFAENEMHVAGDETRTDFAFHVRLNDLARTGPRIAALADHGHTSVKVFMAYGGRGIMVADDELLAALRAAADAGVTVLVHAENGHMSDHLEREARARGATSLGEYYRSRPRWIEVDAVERVLRMLRGVPCPTYLVHLTCVESLEAVAAAKLAGLPVTAETCPHYMLLTADEAASLGSRAKMAPPVRDARDRDGLWNALRAGVVDTVGSDHSAFVRSEKESSADVFEAGFGVPGIATMLPLLHDRGVRLGRIGIERLVDALATMPAQRLGLGGRKGSLAVGCDADFVLFDPDAAFTIDGTSERGNGYYSLYEGWSGRGRVRTVYLRGRPALEDGRLVAEPGSGRFLRRVAARPAVVPA